MSASKDAADADGMATGTLMIIGAAGTGGAIADIADIMTGAAVRMGATTGAGGMVSRAA